MREIPQHYAPFYALVIRYASIMTLVGLITGILYQESSKKAPFSEALQPGIHLETVFHLSLLHGHTFLLGVLIPMAVLAMLHFGLSLNRGVVSKRVLKWGGWLYLPAAAIALLLILYKGYHILLSVRMGELDFEVIEQTYFAGQHTLRKVVYGLAHTSMSFGLGTLAVGIWRSLGVPKETPVPTAKLDA